jgi:predicted RNA binding protein YcfA (HicA-like mRNA interferase family)
MKLTKLVERFLSEPPEVRFEEARYLLEAFGFEEVRSKGSHHIFRHPDKRMQIIPKSGGKRVKKPYVKEIVRLLNLEEWYENQQNES